ncbi:MAG: sigma-70 family RNA polymerase sigma factor [Clostridium sp.]|uniref:sigma-70 family RNA polymerase sigma factor n=1 Tax=Clostridium sp. TaxID=1506 RepID=UPI003067236B
MMKPIKIKGVIHEMDFEQCYCQFAPLRNKIAYEYRHMPMEREDLMQEIDLSFFKAYQAYDNTEFEFMTIVYQIIKNDLWKKIRGYHAVKRQSNVNNVYFNALSQSADKSNELLDLIVKEDNFEEDLNCKLSFERALSKVRRKDKVKAINLLSIGYKQLEVAEIIGCSQTQISRFKMEFREMLLDEICC